MQLSTIFIQLYACYNWQQLRDKRSNLCRRLLEVLRYQSTGEIPRTKGAPQSPEEEVRPDIVLRKGDDKWRRDAKSLSLRNKLKTDPRREGGARPTLMNLIPPNLSHKGTSWWKPRRKTAVIGRRAAWRLEAREQEEPDVVRNGLPL